MPTTQFSKQLCALRQPCIASLYSQISLGRLTNEEHTVSSSSSLESSTNAPSVTAPNSKRFGAAPLARGGSLKSKKGLQTNMGRLGGKRSPWPQEKQVVPCLGKQENQGMPQTGQIHSSKDYYLFYIPNPNYKQARAPPLFPYQKASLRPTFNSNYYRHRSAMGGSLQSVAQSQDTAQALQIESNSPDQASSSESAADKPLESVYESLEAELLSEEFTGLAPDQIKAYYVHVSPYCAIRTIEVGFEEAEASQSQKPKLVLMHGYGASGASTYLRVLKPLSAEFHVILFDLPGMGGSTRVPFFCKTAQQTQEYFLTFMEEWRAAMGQLDSFFLAAHSFGGYIAGLYAHRFPQRVLKLVLVSPIGFSTRPVDWTYGCMKMHKAVDHRGNLIERNYLIAPTATQQVVAPYIWHFQVSPFSIARRLGSTYTRISLYEYVGSRLGIGVEEEGLTEAMVNYLEHIFLAPGSSEAALFLLFDMALFALEPLNSPTYLANSSFPRPISFVFGKHDWVTSDGCQDVLTSNTHFESGQSQLHVVNKSDHCIALENPRDFAQLLIDDFFGRVSHRFDCKYEVYYHRQSTQGDWKEMHGSPDLNESVQFLYDD